MLKGWLSLLLGILVTKNAYCDPVFFPVHSFLDIIYKNGK